MSEETKETVVVEQVTENHVINTNGDESLTHFEMPAVQNNVDGWGPCELPDQFKDIPYQPFSKGDRLGKVDKTIKLFINLK